MREQAIGVPAAPSDEVEGGFHQHREGDGPDGGDRSREARADHHQGVHRGVVRAVEPTRCVQNDPVSEHDEVSKELEVEPRRLAGCQTAQGASISDSRARRSGRRRPRRSRAAARFDRPINQVAAEREAQRQAGALGDQLLHPKAERTERVHVVRGYQSGAGMAYFLGTFPILSAGNQDCAKRSDTVAPVRAGLRLQILLLLGGLLLVTFVPLFYAVATYASFTLRQVRETRCPGARPRPWPATYRKRERIAPPTSS